MRDMHNKITVQTFFNEALSFHGDIYVIEKDGEKWISKSGSQAYFPHRQVTVDGDTVRFFDDDREMCAFHMDVFRTICQVIGFASGTRITAKLIEDAVWGKYVDRERYLTKLIDELITTD